MIINYVVCAQCCVLPKKFNSKSLETGFIFFFKLVLIILLYYRSCSAMQKLQF